MSTSLPATGTPGEALERTVRRWLAQDPDPVTRAELEALVAAGDGAELARRFAGRLSFGTAGLRAELGAGPLRMNRLVVRQAAAGLVRTLQDRGCAAPLVVVGFDARHGSAAFAADTAGVVAAAGGRAVLFTEAGPTPLLAFAVRHLGADAGVMVTASHNPPADNGYKVYLGDGAQIVPPVDAEIAARIDRAATADDPVPVAPPDHPSIAGLDASVIEAYLQVVVGQLTTAPGPGTRRATIAYTPLHGVGAALAHRAFAAAGFPPLHTVDAQERPDPDFPTVAFPNPEEPGALDLGLDLARRVGADVLLANDPDADRLGVAVPLDDGSGGWRALNGNEIGVLLADHLLRRRPGGAERLVVTTIVSSRLLGRMAAAHGVHYAETLTGFKWIVRPALAHPEQPFVFGYEEALGYSVGPAVRDKDGIAAALVFAELVAECRAAGSSVLDRLEALARRFGLHAGAGFSIRFNDRGGGAEQAAAVMARLRAAPPAGLAGRRLVEVEDHDTRVGLDRTDALCWSFDGDLRVVFRPSGTEPKLKVYVELVRAAPAGESFAPGQAAPTATWPPCAARSNGCWPTRRADRSGATVAPPAAPAAQPARAQNTPNWRSPASPRPGTM
ncbi:MAG: phospho-sugar mutase [Acidimicrobiales bacterium]